MSGGLSVLNLKRDSWRLTGDIFDYIVNIVKVRYFTKKIEKEGESGPQGYDL